MANSHRYAVADREGYTLACPNCDQGGSLRERTTPADIRKGDPDDRYLCRNCGESTDNPNERPYKDSSFGNPGNTSLKGLAKRLADMDPDEVGS